MEKTKGIFLVAFGKRGYMYSAYNLARSIKFFNNDLPITIFCDDTVNKWIEQYQREVFDTIIVIPEEIKRDKYGQVYPAQIKTSIYPFLQYDYNLFLDVDSLAMQDLTPIFDELKKDGGYFYTNFYSEHSLQDGREIPGMIWAYADDVWSHFKLPDDAKLPCVNSSFQYIEKCDESEKLFLQIQENLRNPIPLEKLRTQWGASQPDELYIDVALCQRGITGKPPRQLLWFTHQIDKRSPFELAKEFPILSLFGHTKMIRPRYIDFYDRRMIEYMRKWQMPHAYKFYIIIHDKHANTRPKVIAPKLPTAALLPSLIPIENSTIIDSNKLIQNYINSDGRILKPNCWLNGSFIQYHGRTFFAYRMEVKPYCTRMKIGLCLMDENLVPIPESNVLLNLHTELKPFPKGFHAEDPRLFIFNDELYLSYTDGYQMAQAKINTDSLQAEENFYIRKPIKDKTEKNWVFFEHEKTLYSVYNTFPHVIYKMNGSDWEHVHKTEYEASWPYGFLSGGATPIKVGNVFYSFFHSAQGVNYRGQQARQYFTGCYTFQAKPPFKPIAISREPLFSGQHMADSIPRISNKLFVVFPSGVIRKKESFLISFGYNDYENRIVEISDAMLKENMVPIVYKENLVEA